MTTFAPSPTPTPTPTPATARQPAAALPLPSPSPSPTPTGSPPHHAAPPPRPAHAHAHAPFAHQLHPPPAAFAASNPPVSRRTSRDLRHHGSNGAMAGHRDAPFAGPRSPPSNKNTSHVPCKFYRQGACQAGKACPFLHSDEPLTERAPCKYFTKGNCKFGQKCALAHILPNGHVVNRHNASAAAAAHFARMNLPPHGPPELPPTSSLLTMQAHMTPLPPAYPYAPHDDYAAHKSQYDMIPTIDTTFSSHPGSNYGSPPNENGRTPLSPVQKGLSVMDVPLPASFDSQGISHMARYGPIASSVPAKFLAGSPPSSYHADSTAIRNLHDSAFGDGSRSRPVLASSPPESVEQPVGRRVLHSELAANRARGIMSSSVGARPVYKDDDWDDPDMIGKFEEDLLPNSLSDLLTPQEKMRRFSRDQADLLDTTSFSHRAPLSRLGASPTAAASDLKIASPNAATASPSRFQSLWGKPQSAYTNGFESGSPGASAFGHVGSPLRNSTLQPGASPSLRAINRPTPGDTSPFVSSPPRHTAVSMLNEQMQRTRLSSRDGTGFTSSPVHPGINRVTSASSVGSSGGRLGIDRAVSSSSINRERIEEEQGLFSMEEEEDLLAKGGRDGASTTSSNNSNKRLSGISWGSGGKSSPNLVPVGGHRATGSSGLGRENNPWSNNNA
ncbi:hypothetical protein ACEQ8H_001200 [Pleosporales sp. CAS-2024a]